MSYLLALALVSALVVVHELGHFLAAKWVGIPIARFSVGFGPKVWGFQWKQTECVISLIPLGGYVLPALESEWDFFNIDLKKRLFFSIAGPFANLILAVPMFALINLVSGSAPSYGIIAPFIQTFDAMKGILVSFSMILATPDHISSVIGIVSAGGHFVETGVVGTLKFAILMTLNLAIFNLLPLPPLDGGKIILDVIGKALPKLSKAYVPACVMGWLLLIGVMFYATAQDILRMMASTGPIVA